MLSKTPSVSKCSAKDGDNSRQGSESREAEAPSAAAVSQPMLEHVTFSPITVPWTCSGTSVNDAIGEGRAIALQKT
jgi:hypothetical protein